MPRDGIKLSMEKEYFTPDDDFTALIKTHFAEASDLLLIETGWTNFVFRVSTAQGLYYFRFPRNAFFAAALVKESHFMQFIRDKVNFVTPDLQLYEYQGCHYSVHAALSGESLEACYHDLTPDEKQAVARDIADAIRQLAQIDLRTAGFQGQRLSNFLDGLAAVSQNDYDLAQHDFLKELESQDLVCCHGDFNPGNIILKDHRFYGVIDFAFAGVSSPLIDLSRIIGRTPGDFKPLLLTAFAEQGITVNPESLAQLQDIWRYVEAKYILYMKQNHPWIVLPSLT